MKGSLLTFIFHCEPVFRQDPIYIIYISRVAKFERALYSGSMWRLAGLDFVPLATFEGRLSRVLEIPTWGIINHRLEIFREMKNIVSEFAHICVHSRLVMRMKGLLSLPMMS